MTAWQVWGRPDEPKYIPQCEACGEYLRSSPIYDGSTGFCIRKRCIATRAREESLPSGIAEEGKKP